MSGYIVGRSKHHKVEHSFSGKHHFFSVENPKGTKYDVVIKANCTCEFMGKEGIATGKICSHITAVCRAIAKQGAVKPKEEMYHANQKN